MDDLHDIEDDGLGTCNRCETEVDADDLDEGWVCSSCRQNEDMRHQDASDYRHRAL